MNEKHGSVRKRFTPAQRRQILADYQAGGLTQREFASRAGVSLASLGKWLRARRLSPAEPSGPGFLELPLPSAARPASGGPEAPGSQGAYKMHLPDGLCLELPRGFSPEEARQLLQLARAL